MKAVARKKFIDKYTNEKHEAGDLLDLEPERYEEIRETDPNLVIAVADEQSTADDGKTEQEAAGQSAVEDAETEDGKTEPVAAGQSAAEDAETADGKKKPKNKTKKSDE